MADRTYRGGRERYDRERNQGYGRQAEQFDSTEQRWRDEERGYGQMGEGWRDEDYGQFDTGGQSYSRERDFGRERPMDRAANREAGYGASRYGAGNYGAGRTTESRGFGSFTGSDFGGRDFTSPRYTASNAVGSTAASYGAGSQLAAAHGEWRDRGDWDWGDGRDGRGFLERAGDTLAGWLGDGTVRREHDYRGRGPANYTRSDERILEDACDALTDDRSVDARNVEVSVLSGEVTLDGTVSSREQKRRAEDCVDRLSGVKNVQNNLRVQERSTWDRNNSNEMGSQSDPTTESN
jgi:osmotically-inducible protein OsmY